MTSARTDLAAAAGSPRPRFTLGPLHDLRCDPILLRQLFDNLIGNAVKYTAPGVEPRIVVASTLLPDGMVRVEIADNGIGIPPGHHDAISRTSTGRTAPAGTPEPALAWRSASGSSSATAAPSPPTTTPAAASRFAFTLPGAEIDARVAGVTC